MTGRQYYYPSGIKRKAAVQDAINRFYARLGYYPQELHFPVDEAVNIEFPIKTVRTRTIQSRNFILGPIVRRDPRMFIGKRKRV
jgi:hypothetical protein